MKSRLRLPQACIALTFLFFLTSLAAGVSRAQHPVAVMPFLGRIQVGYLLHLPALLPKFKDDKDWLFMPVKDGFEVPLRIWQFASLEDSTHVDFGLARDWDLSVDRFRADQIRFGDVNGDGRADYGGGWKNWLISSDTGHALVAIDTAINFRYTGDVYDFDGDGYDDIVGDTAIRWGAAVAPLSSSSRVLVESFVPERSRSFHALGSSKGVPFLIVESYAADRSCIGDTSRSYRYEYARYARLNAEDVASHRSEIRIEPSSVRLLSGAFRLWCNVGCEGCMGKPDQYTGKHWPKDQMYRYRRGGYVRLEDWRFDNRITVTDTGVVWPAPTSPFASFVGIGLGGRSTSMLTGDHDIGWLYDPDASRTGWFGRRLALVEFADSTANQLSIRSYLSMPDSLLSKLSELSESLQHFYFFRFPDITKDGRAELAIAYKNGLSSTWNVDILDAFGALPATSVDRESQTATPSLGFVLRDHRATWTGARAHQYVVRSYDLVGRLLRVVLAEGSQLSTTGVDLDGLIGNIVLTIEGGGVRQTHLIRLD